MWGVARRKTDVHTPSFIEIDIFVVEINKGGVGLDFDVAPWHLAGRSRADIAVLVERPAAGFELGPTGSAVFGGRFGKRCGLGGDALGCRLFCRGFDIREVFAGGEHVEFLHCRSSFLLPIWRLR